MQIRSKINTNSKLPLTILHNADAGKGAIRSIHVAGSIDHAPGIGLHRKILKISSGNVWRTISRINA
jgi:hypothetical protein